MKIFLAALKIINWFLSKRQKNHLTEEPSASIVEEPTSEKITMETQTDPVNQVRDWAMGKIELLHEADRHKNAKALLAEFDEWINLPEDQDEIEYLCIEDDDWTDEQEIDVL